MRLLFTLLFSFVFSCSILSQDVIVKYNGDELEVKVVEVDFESIKYKKFSNLNGPVYNISKSEIFFIKYENGDKDIFREFQNSNQTARQEGNNQIVRIKRKRNMSVSGELGGLSVWTSVKFEYLVVNKPKYKLGIRTGIGYGPMALRLYYSYNYYYTPGTREMFNFPLNFTNIVGNGSHFYEGGLGFNFTDWDQYIHTNQGYRYQPRNKNFFIAGSINLIYNLDDDLYQITPGVAYGFRF